MIEWLYDLFDNRTFGAARSSGWEAASRAYRNEQPFCEFGMHKPTLLNPLNTHHVESFMTCPEKEMLKSNWLNVCRFHHYAHCHFFNWKDSNPAVREDASLFNDELYNHHAIPI